MATEHAVTPVRYEIHKIGHDSSIITMTAVIAKSFNFLSSHRVMYTVWFPLPTHPRENGPAWEFILALEVSRPGCRSMRSCWESGLLRPIWWRTTLGSSMVLDILTSSFSPRRRQWHPTPVLLPGKSHGQRSLVGCSPWGR